MRNRREFITTVASASALGTGARAEAWLVVDVPSATTGTREVNQIVSVSGNTFTLRTPLNSAHAVGQTVRLAELGDAAVGKFGGNVPHFPQQKYPARTSAVAFSSGWEMRLIQAEEALVRVQVAQAVGFMNRVFAAAEAQDHHPDLYNVWAFVTIKWSTHDVGGLTAWDFAMAAREYESTLSLERRMPAAWGNLANDLLRHRKLRRAIRLISKSLWLCPDDVLALDIRGLAHLRLGMK